LQDWTQENLDQVFAEEIQHFQSDLEWLECHRRELTEQYSDQWVFVQDKEVIATGPDLEPLVEKLRSEGVDTARIYSARLHVVPPKLILVHS